MNAGLMKKNTLQNARDHLEKKSAGSLALAVTQFKMDLAFQNAGFKIAEDEQGPLPSLHLPAGDQTAELRLMFRYREFPASIDSLFQKYQNLWDRRLVLNSSRLGRMADQFQSERPTTAPKKVA